MRGISPNFINDLKTGILSKVLERVKADSTLVLEIRENYINIYYRGGNALKISEKCTGNYEFWLDLSYIKNSSIKDRISAIPSLANDSSSVSLWVDELPNIKDQMDLYFGRNSKEREYQQVVVLENNYGSTANDTDYYICDIEYANTDGRFDMIAVKWPSTSFQRKQKDNLGLVFVEMKYMDKALTGNSGLADHIKGMNTFLSNPQNIQDIKKEMIQVFNQKVDLGLLVGIKPISSFNDDKPEFVFLIANHDPAKSVLRRELDDLICSSVYSDFCAKADLKFATACFMGYGLYQECMQDISVFMNQNSHLIRQ